MQQKTKIPVVFNLKSHLYIVHVAGETRREADYFVTVSEQQQRQQQQQQSADGDGDEGGGMVVSVISHCMVEI
ncbi:hypothetical protein CesoFtcFv8_022800 [Champsocephalus esox]|uniref:Uncharacterized protein n=1 Tax=Champsocephalus esox TaxID=159716 RepID=A0AAN8B7H6_9TELE|nr:hypothetical protein CesoFtcFv8_022800 [Champsocephalus esox]